MRAYWIAFSAVQTREFLRFVNQRSRFISALVRPLLWLLVFATGFRAALGVSIIAPYETYITYETYIVPGLCAMILLFNGMQSSLSLVMDREVGSMRLLLAAPIPLVCLLFARLSAGTLLGVLQVYTFLGIAAAFGIQMPIWGYLAALPALILTGLMLGAVGLALSLCVKMLENFAAVMNFVIFPVFFLSSALYPIWKMAESSQFLGQVCLWNPFTSAVEIVRFALYLKLSFVDLSIVLATGSLSFVVVLLRFRKH